LSFPEAAIDADGKYVGAGVPDHTITIADSHPVTHIAF